jgi:tetratricopeptide (TPR) repeat protein
MKKILFIVCTLFFFVGCSSTVTTPAIEGTVIDKVTKQPVENAWIMAIAEVITHNPGGANSNYYLLTKPHTKTDKEGRFSIPSFSTGGNGTELAQLKIDIYAPEDKRGVICIKKLRQSPSCGPVYQDETAIIQPSESLDEKKLVINIPIKNEKLTIKQRDEEFGWLFRYCNEDGRYYYAVPAIQNGCTDTEMGYLISANERFLQEVKKPRNVVEEGYYARALGRLSALYEKKGNYIKAHDYFLTAIDFDKKRGLNISSKSEKRLIELKSKIQENR